MKYGKRDASPGGLGGIEKQNYGASVDNPVAGSCFESPQYEVGHANDPGSLGGVDRLDAGASSGVEGQPAKDADIDVGSAPGGEGTHPTELPKHGSGILGD